MAFNFLYNNNPISDHLVTLTYINEITQLLSTEKILVDESALFKVLTEMKTEFPHVDGLDKASAFKKAGLFLTSFIAESPIQSSLDIEKIGPELHKKPNHANIIIGLQIVIDSLDGASVCRNGNSPIKLTRIKISMHTYIDLIEALHGLTLQNHYKLITVLLEQLVYKTNPKAQYETIDV